MSELSSSEIPQNQHWKNLKIPHQPNVTQKHIHFQQYQCKIISFIQHKKVINRHTDGEIEIHEICQFHVNGFRVTLNERKRRQHSREFNANSHVVGKTNMRCDTFCHVPPRYWVWVSVKKLCVHQVNRSCRTFVSYFWRVWKIDYVTKKSTKKIFCVLLPLFPCSWFTFRELQSFSIPQTSLNYRKIYYVRNEKGNGSEIHQKHGKRHF
jgi:hypothetical protein